MSGKEKIIVFILNILDKHTKKVYPNVRSDYVFFVNLATR
jgi:hypothetical protein